MVVTMKENEMTVWKGTPWMWVSMTFAAALLGFIYFDGLKDLLHVWETKLEYSYGYLIPFITLFLVWQRKNDLERIPFSGSWIGALVVLFGLGMSVLGEMTTLYLVIQISMVIVLAGIALALTGREAFRFVRIPILFLIFMVPLPSFFLQEISGVLQLISSAIGVSIIRLFGISVFLEGNVIDLGALKLQVVEACSGLRYLFPLMTLGFIAAYFFKVSLWKRAIVFLSTIPITVLMNSFRIGVIGVLVEYWGSGMAYGFLHDFEGWAVFMACTAVLVGEMWILTKIGSDHRPWQEIFGIEFPAPSPKDASIQYRFLPKPFLAALLLVGISAAVSLAMPTRVEVPPVRQEFSNFPMKLDEWQGSRGRLEQIYLDELKLDDYVIADFVDPNQHLINLYVAYYATQRKHQSAHSPRTCIPGGGWEITSLTQHNIEGVQVGGIPLDVNRAVIQMGDSKQLVYYWFQQRGRVVTNEYMVKWYIFKDAVVRNRTDGALVRLVIPVRPGENLADADRILAHFIKTLSTRLSEYVPD